MGCVHTHWGILAIEGWGSPSHIWKVMENTKEANQKPRKIGRTIGQALTLRPKHDRIQAQWTSDIPSKNMLKKVWWCKCFKMESWNWTIYYQMNCSNEQRHAQFGDGRRSHAALRCYWKGKVLLSTCVKASRRKGCWSTINLTTMIEATKAQF